MVDSYLLIIAHNTKEDSKKLIEELKLIINDCKITACSMALKEDSHSKNDNADQEFKRSYPFEHDEDLEEQTGKKCHL